jgi:chromosome segregation ATPase
MATISELAEQASTLQAHADELSHRFQTLGAYEEAARFDSDALAAIRLFERYKADLEGFLLSQEALLREAVSARNSLPFLKRLFASRSEEKQLASSIATARGGIASVETATSDLYELIDRTPSSKSEQKDMLAELRLLKKEVTTQKRSVNEAMQGIRTKARQDMASWTGVSGRGVVGSVARLERMSIRHGKEGALAPHESTKASLERQIIDLERRINWVDRFQGGDPKPEEAPLRCAYCGRRVKQNAVCPGCGSDRTTRDL